jgi:hypothetical protein
MMGMPHLSARRQARGPSRYHQFSAAHPSPH